MSSLFKQPLLDIHDEMVCDNFAGGGGASVGIEAALGRPVDVAINHNAAALSMHQANHPQTVHIQSDVFEVNPYEVCDRPVGLAWFSPDCTYYSKARGAKPIRHKNKKRRALAWVVLKWAGQLRRKFGRGPRVIMLENVEEFASWGPLVGTREFLRPCKKRRGKTFKRFVRLLRDLDYRVESRELRACDYGAPTIRKRLFLIARCDAQPIVWPEPTHGAADSPGVKSGRLKPFRTAAECIDWSQPMLSIFATKDEAKAWAKKHHRGVPIRPLADQTNRRIARGVMKFVVNNPKPYFRLIDNERGTSTPFFVTAAHGEGKGKTKRWGESSRSVEEPIPTITGKGGTAIVSPFIGGVGGRAGQSPERSVDLPAGTVTGKADQAVIAPFSVPRYQERDGQNPRCASLDQPSPTIVPGGNCPGQVVAAFLGQYNGGFAAGNSGDGRSVDDPTSTISTKGPHQAVVAACLDQANGGFENRVGRAIDEPLSTILANGQGHQGIIAAHVDHNNTGWNPSSAADEPLHTITAEGARHNVIAAHIGQNNYGDTPYSAADSPLRTIVAGGTHHHLVASFLQTYYGTGTGQEPSELLRTIPTLDRFGLVGVSIAGVMHVITDICMRMLMPRELYLCQGFPPGYVINMGHDGRKLTASAQVQMCGNSVSPPVATALVRANCPDLISRPELMPARCA